MAGSIAPEVGNKLIPVNLNRRNRALETKKRTSFLELAPEFAFSIVCLFASSPHNVLLHSVRRLIVFGFLKWIYCYTCGTYGTIPLVPMELMVPMQLMAIPMVTNVDPANTRTA